MGPAYQLGMDREVGSIEVGKLADVAVLERNLFEILPKRDTQDEGRDDGH